MQQWGSQLIKASDIAYLQTAVLKVSETESLVDTRFNVEHTEALEALAKVPAWSLGHSLPDGHEFLAIVEKRSYSSTRGMNFRSGPYTHDTRKRLPCPVD